MSEIGERVERANELFAAEVECCPFCGLPKHPHDSLKQPNANDKVESKPRSLSCSIVLDPAPPFPSNTARHHLISALQCYARVKRLVRMAKSVGYDINNEKNGVGLPTISPAWYFPDGLLGGPVHYTRTLTDDVKRRIAFGVMDRRHAQWHVGHHAHEVVIPDEWADETQAADRGHAVSYDEEVIRLLLDLVDAWQRPPQCAGEDKSEKLKEDMNKISKEILDKLSKFGTPFPWLSQPFFVSVFAYQYALRIRESVPKTLQNSNKRGRDGERKGNGSTKRAKVVGVNGGTG